jgi:hypothetical protein
MTFAQRFYEIGGHVWFPVCVAVWIPIVVVMWVL